ncbi:MAG: hypothetical protein IJK20_04485 [Bacteroidales bacterium]|nr:hypothetical protein [Bacteroidales bacterium]
MEKTVRRAGKLIPLAQARRVGVVLNLENPDCAESVRYLNDEAARFGFAIDYLLINPFKVAIPQWALRDGMTVINYKVDFDGACRFITGTAEKFWIQERDYLIALSAAPSSIIDAIMQESAAGFKIGRAGSASERIYDLTVRIGWNERGGNLAELLLSSLKVLTREIDQREDEEL